MKKRTFLRRLLPLVLCLIFMITTLTAPASAASTASALDLSPIRLPVLQNYGGETAAAFQNVSYSYLGQSNIVKLDSTGLTKNIRTGGQVAGLESAPRLTAQEIIEETGYIKKADLEKYTPNNVKPGTIFVDETNKLAFKVDQLGAANITNPNFADYVSIVKAEPYEVLSDFTIPNQEVKLTRGNINHFGDGMEQCLVSGNESAKTYVMSQTAGSDDYSGKNLDELKAKHLKDPLLQFKFSKTQLTGYTASGGSVKVELSGYLGIDSIAAHGGYSSMKGYQFYLSTGEEIYLKAVISGDMNDEICIPIVGIDIPAAIADVKGGLFLIVGVDGEFTLVTEARQWLLIDKFGIGGGTFAYIPTSFHPLFQLGDRGLDVDASFNGSVNGYIKAGPMLDLEILGFDAAGAGALFGGGVNCSEQGDYIDADIYGIANIYATLMDHDFNLINWTPTLFHKRQVNTGGYKVAIAQADAWRQGIWGHIDFDNPSNGGLSPYGNGAFGLVITDANGKLVHNFGANVLTNDDGTFSWKKVKLNDGDRITMANGDFSLKDVSMNNGDQIYVIVPDHKTAGILYHSAPFSPTFPFQKVVIEKLDFFNDTVQGNVPSVFLKDPVTGILSEYKYNTGNVDITLTNPGGSNSVYHVPVDSEGNFVIKNTLEQPVNVLPQTVASAQINFQGFPVNSNTDVKPSANFIGRRILIPVSQRTYYENGQRIDEVTEEETFIIYNLGGLKTLTDAGLYNAKYKLHNFDNVIDPNTGYPIFNNAEVGQEQAAISPIPCAGVLTDDGIVSGGASSVVNKFVTRWAWAKPDASRTTPPVRSLLPLTPTKGSLLPITTIMPENLQINRIITPQLNLPPQENSQNTIDVGGNLQIGTNYKSLLNRIIGENPQNTVEYRYDSWHPAPDDTSTAGVDTGSAIGYTTTVGGLRRVGELEFNYEGANITVTASGDEEQKSHGRKVLYNSTDMVNFDRYLSRMFWSTVSPMPDQAPSQQFSTGQQFSR